MKHTSKALAGSALGGLALAAFHPSSALGDTKLVNVALIGCGGRGLYVARGMIEQGAHLVAICDLHPERLQQGKQFLSQVQDRFRCLKDYEKVLDHPKIDAVVIATPDHWHGPLSILACQAGKDVYVEKPHAHNIWESRKMIEAARKYNRVLQVGTQNRSAPYNLAAREYIKSGNLGDIRLVKVYNLKPGGPFHLGSRGDKPVGMDWDVWLGPVSERPYHQNLFKGGWHHFWDFSGGDLCDDAAHQVDLALMLMGNPGMPLSVSSAGGRLQHKGDDSEVPDLLVTTYEYQDFIMTLEHANYPRYMRKTTTTIRRNDELPYWTQNATRIELYGSEKMMIIGRHGGGWVVMTSGGKIVEKMYGRVPDAVHQKNFLEAVQSRETPNADINLIHPSCTLLHIANIAHRTGNQKLRFDAQQEIFVNNVAANTMVKRNYRTSYAIPEKV